MKKEIEKKGKKKRKEKEESKLKIHKGWFGFNGGYPSRKPIKDNSGKGRKS